MLHVFRFIKQLMADSISKSLFHNLKNFFKKEELSDKTLKIFELHNSDKILKIRKRKISGEKQEDKTCKIQKTADTLSGNVTDSHIESTAFQTEEKASQANQNVKGSSIEEDLEDEVDMDEHRKENNHDKEIPSLSVEEPTESLYTTFPVHSIVLCLHSEFFEKMLTVSGMREASSNIIELKVPAGEGKNLELLICSFYDEHVLECVKSISELLKLMDMAERYCCLSFVEKGLHLLSHFSIFTVEDCNMILERCYHFKTFLNIPDESDTDKVNLFQKVEKQCVEFMIEQFSPLECNFRNALHLSFSSLYILLRDATKLAFSEDTILVMLYEWLRINEPDGKESIHIEELLSCIRYQYCSKFFLIERLSLNDLILSKCSFYPEWLLHAVSYHSIGEESRVKRGYPPTKIQSRNITDAECINNYIFTLTFPQDSLKCADNGACFVHAGYIYGVDVKVRTSGSVHVAYNVGLYAYEPPFEREDELGMIDETITIGYALLPGNVFYDDNLFHGEQFQRMKKYFRKFSVNFKDFLRYIKLPTIHADTEFHENVRLQGIQLALIVGSSYKIIEKLHEIKHTSFRPRVVLRGNDMFVPNVGTSNNGDSSPDLLIEQ